MEIRTSSGGVGKGREEQSAKEGCDYSFTERWKKVVLLHRIPSTIFEFKKKSAGTSRCFLSSVLEQVHGCVCWQGHFFSLPPGDRLVLHLLGWPDMVQEPWICASPRIAHLL